MTLTDLRPDPPAPRAAPPPPPPHPDRAPRPRRRATALVPTEVALIVLTLVTAASYARVFVDWEWLRPLATLTIASHLLAIACRRAGWGLVTSTVVGLGGLAVALSLVFYQGVSAFGLPTRATWDRAGDDLAAAWDDFATAIPLIPAGRGYLVAAGVGLWLAAWFADAFAFRARAGFEAVLPTAILFVFASAVAADRHRVLFAALWMGVALVVLALHRLLRQETSSGWLAAGRHHSPVPGVLGVSCLLAAVAVLGGAFVGPRLPGSGAKALIDTSNDDSSRTTLSPIVNIKGRLSGNSEVEAFIVRSDAPAYWRLTALTLFDGTTWTSRGSVDDAVGDLPPGFDDNVEGTAVNQAFEITGLDQIWLPAAFSPVGVDGAGITFDRATSSLVSEADDPQGLQYEVTSVLPAFDVDALATASRDSSDEARRNLGLPDDFPDALRAQAEAIVSDVGADTPYEQARALQDWFRANFTYDLGFRAGHSDEVIEEFLAARRGYCEQFAGTYAAFARALGLPARVAIGFTQGVRQEDGSYVVQGKHAHAWPEVLFPGVGWVPFEPTPGRGNPQAVAYTGVAPAQADEPGTDVPPVPITPVSDNEVPPEFDLPPELLDDLGLDAGAAAAPVDDGGGVPDWLVRFGLVLVIAGLVAVAWLGLLATLRRTRRDRRRRDATTAADQVLVAWTEASEALGRTGQGPAASETPLEFAQRARRTTGVAPDLLGQLAMDVTTAGYAADGVEPDAVRRSTETVTAIERAVHERSPLLERLKWAADPRPLLSARTRVGARRF